MSDFFEDDINYYIEMIPHGLPGMDLFDYIEMRTTMEEAECRNIFRQVVAAVHHLHTRAFVVHRDIKDENVILDGEGQIKLIDFGSAAYIKNGPFDVFVGTIGKHPTPCRNNLYVSLLTFDTGQTTPRPKCCRASHTGAKSKMSGRLESSSIRSFTRRIRSTASTKSWIASSESRGS